MTDATSETSSSTSPSLIQRACAQDPEAWQRLSDLYAPMVYEWARRAGLQESDAADVVQEVFQAVSKRMTDPDKDGLRGFRRWLWGVTRNQIRLHYRRRYTRPQAAGGTNASLQLEEYPDWIEQDSHVSSEESRNALVRRALQIIQCDFETKTWQAFRRLAIEGHTAAEIAEDLAMSESAVRQAKYRVLCRLRDELVGS